MKKICLFLALCLFLAACSAFAEEAAKASALIDQAQAALEAQDYETAVPLLQKAAEMGDPTGQLWLGYCYHKGLGTGIDYEKARDLYLRAELSGVKYASQRLGQLDMDMRNAG